MNALHDISACIPDLILSIHKYAINNPHMREEIEMQVSDFERG